MPIFEYKAVDSKNHIETGSLSAKDSLEVAVILKKQNLKPIVIKKEAKAAVFKGKVPPIEKINLVRHLATMLSSGIPLTEGVGVLAKETKNPIMKKLLSDTTYGLDQGQQLSSIFMRYPSIFDTIFITLTKAGEMSGSLSDSFSYLEDELRADYELSQKIKGALLYPGIVFIAMMAIAILMFFFILPQIAKVFLSMRLPLPAFTQFLFQSSLAAVKYTWVWIAGIIVGVILFTAFLQSQSGKRILVGLISPLPFVKKILKLVDLARFTRIFSTLIKSAVPITEALDIALSTMIWKKFQGLNIVIGEQVRKGKSLSSAFRQVEDFPIILTQMIAAGEKTGTLDANMKDLSEFYSEEVEDAVKNATTLLEPMLMLLVGIGVGGIILSIIGPLYSVVGNLQSVR